MPLADLEQALTKADPAILLVPSRILRRVIKQDRGLGGLGLRVPHRKSYILDRAALLAAASREELGLPPECDLPDTVILLPRPEAPQRRKSSEENLLRYWRLLFHARVHAALAARRLTDDAIHDRVRRLGRSAFAEVRAVLTQEHALLPPGDERAIYDEFAALYLELRRFAPHLLPRYFPGLDQLDAVDRLLAQDVDTDALFAQTRPAGAPDPDRLALPEETVPTPLRAAPTSGAPAPAGGNLVRAARLAQRAGRAEEARAAVHRLVDRLHAALNFPAEEIAAWRAALEALLPAAAASFWPPEAKLLFELQNVCVDHEKEIYAVDLVEWAVTGGRRPVQRLLPYQPLVLTVRHLRRAAARLVAARLPDEPRHLLSRLLADATHRAEHRLREGLRPQVVRALDEVELTPASYPERLARDQMVEELLDRVAARGYLTMSDLRDAIARNRLKLPDLAGPLELLRGDRLIRANRCFARHLDGIYRRGEVYLRWLQRLSALFFGTRFGRFLVLYFLLPFGGAFLVLEGLQHLVEPILHLVAPVPAPPPRPVVLAALIGFAAEPAGMGPLAALGYRGAVQPHHESWAGPWSIALVGLFLFGLLHVPPLRRGVLMALHLLARALALVLHDLPAAFLAQPLMRAVMQSRVYLLVYQVLLKPLACAAPVALGLYLAAPAGVVWGVSGGVFLLAALFLNSRLGQRVEEATADTLLRGWHLVAHDVLPGLFRWTLALFRWLVDGVDRCLYTVEEWLRFRTGDSRLSLALKPILGLAWFLVAYLVRFAVNLLLEPQLNPIKHFPVVTVSHKLLLPMVPGLARSLGWTLQGTTLVVSGIPGIFGFLAWELKENWRLYRANQADTFEPEVVGHHGETVLRLMRPGFHSGTLPKLYAALRRNERRQDNRKARVQREALHHVEEAIARFAERSFCATLAGSRCWAGPAPQVTHVHAATNRIRVAFAWADAREPLVIAFEEVAGCLVAEVVQPGWLPALSLDRAAALRDALAGLYARAGVAQVCVGDTLAAMPPVCWTDWLATWQRDQDGKGHEPTLLPGILGLPKL